MARTKARSSTRRARRQTATKRRTAPKAARTARRQTKPRQRFVVSHHREEDFEGGLRRYAKYRDLGIANATNGMVRAHVIRFIPPCRPEEVSKRHYHDVDFQMVYVLKGWISPVNLNFYAFIFNTLHEHGRKWLARCRNTVATFSRSDPNDREALSSKTKTELKCRESRSIQEIKPWARPRIELSGHGIRQPRTERGVTNHTVGA